MTEDEIQGLARRWAAHVDGPRWAFVDSLPAPLTEEERDALFAWARQAMADADVDPEFARTQQMLVVAERLGIDYVAGGRLCEAVGWPR
jgi:hypothetical protein